MLDPGLCARYTQAECPAFDLGATCPALCTACPPPSPPTRAPTRAPTRDAVPALGSAGDRGDAFPWWWVVIVLLLVVVVVGAGGYRVYRAKVDRDRQISEFDARVRDDAASGAAAPEVAGASPREAATAPATRAVATVQNPSYVQLGDNCGATYESIVDNVSAAVVVGNDTVAYAVPMLPDTASRPTAPGWRGTHQSRQRRSRQQSTAMITASTERRRYRACQGATPPSFSHGMERQASPTTAWQLQPLGPCGRCPGRGVPRRARCQLMQHMIHDSAGLIRVL